MCLRFRTVKWQNELLKFETLTMTNNVCKSWFKSQIDNGCVRLLWNTDKFRLICNAVFLAFGQFCFWFFTAPCFVFHVEIFNCSINLINRCTPSKWEIRMANLSDVVREAWDNAEILETGFYRSYRDIWSHHTIKHVSTPKRQTWNCIFAMITALAISCCRATVSAIRKTSSVTWVRLLC